MFTTSNELLFSPKKGTKMVAKKSAAKPAAKPAAKTASSAKPAFGSAAWFAKYPKAGAKKK